MDFKWFQSGIGIITVQILPVNLSWQCGKNESSTMYHLRWLGPGYLFGGSSKPAASQDWFWDVRQLWIKTIVNPASLFQHVQPYLSPWKMTRVPHLKLRREWGSLPLLPEGTPKVFQIQNVFRTQRIVTSCRATVLPRSQKVESGRQGYPAVAADMRWLENVPQEISLEESYHPQSRGEVCKVSYDTRRISQTYRLWISTVKTC